MVHAHVTAGLHWGVHFIYIRNTIAGAVKKNDISNTRLRGTALAVAFCIIKKLRKIAA